MRKIDFSNFRVSIGTVVRLIVAAGGLWLLISRRILFFQGNRVIKSNSVMNPAVDIPLETVRRPIFFILLILLLLAAADTIRMSCRAGSSKSRRLTAGIQVFIVSAGLVFLNAVLSFLEIELINNYYLVRMETQFKIINILITFVLYLVAVFAVNSVTIGMEIGNLFFLLWGTVNYFVQRFRGSPFQWVDLSAVRTAASVADHYTYEPNWEIVACWVLTAAVIIFLGNHRSRFIFKKISTKIAGRGIAVLLMAVFITVFFKTGFLAGRGVWLRDWQPWYTYRLFGMESGFLEFARASFPKEPDKYSSAEVKKIIREAEETAPAAAAPAAEEIPENIIVIMNEAFSDLRVYPGFSTDVSMMPFIDSLTENTQKGNLLVSVKGGLTCNTEYEFLTGNSCVLSPQTVVFTSYIKDKQYTAARTLSAQGYRAVAMHPYKAKGWSRSIVYPRMGLDTFLSIENAYENAETVRGYVSDRGDYEEIIRQTEQKEKGEKLFLFNVTMQNHSSYDDASFKSTVHVKNYSGTKSAAADQYASLVRLSDEAFKELTEYYSRSDQKTLICFFGDHQPEISDDFWEYCAGKHADSLSFEEEQRQYQSKYVIWANYDIPESDGKLLSANYLYPYLLSLAGLEQAPYGNYLLNQMKTIPAMNAFGYLGTDGRQHEWDTDDVPAEEQETLRKYKCLIYNELTAGGARDGSFFGLKDSGDG